MSRALVLVMLLAPVLGACRKTVSADDPQQQIGSEARRERDCANPQWKAANLGLWYNLCQTGDQLVSH